MPQLLSRWVQYETRLIQFTFCLRGGLKSVDYDLNRSLAFKLGELCSKSPRIESLKPTADKKRK
jgi:hypothetical protein